MALDILVDVGDVEFLPGTPNVPGIWNIGIADKRDIASISNGIITMKAGRRFVKVYTTDGKASVTFNKGSADPDVTGFTRKVAFSSPGLTEQLGNLAETTASGEWVILAREGGDCDSAEWHIIGNLCKGATQTKADGNSGAAIGDYKGFDFEFTSNAENNPIQLLKNADPTLLFGIPAPAALGGSSITTTGFTANWTQVAGATGYRLDVSTSPTFDTFVSGNNNRAVSGGSTTNAAVTGLTTGTVYYYRVRAEDASGAGANSNVVSVTTS